MDLASGTALQNGKYVLETVLGHGGFGITYRAHHAYLDQPVVVKVLNENLRRHPDFAQFQQQFIAEARRIAKCQHPNIVRVFDFFEEGGLSFIVMDYIPGRTLADIVQVEGPLPEAKAIHYMHQIGAALQVVHQAGLLHRDVKPHNIMRREHTDFVVLIDFGISREFTPGVTQTHTGMLSAGYAPIEQYLPQGKRTPALDIYALAATLYSLVTGQAPIAAPLRDRVPLLEIRQFQPQISPAVERAILKGMEMEAQARPQTITDWLALLPASQFAASTTNSGQGSAGASGTPAQPLYSTATSATLPVVPRYTPAATPPAASRPPVSPNSYSTVAASSQPAQPRQPARPRPAPVKPWLPKALILASAIAACVGGGVGLALRLSGSEAGGTLFNREQSFPGKEFPGDEVPASIPPDVPIEQPAVEQDSAPPASSDIDPTPVEPSAPLVAEPEPSPEVEPTPLEATPAPIDPVDVAPSPIPEPAAEPPVSETPAPVAEPEPAPEPLPPVSAPVPAEPAPPSDTAPDASTSAPAAPPLPSL